MALPFYDRVVQHAINNVLEPIFDKRFISQSYACRKGKGMHAASDTLKEWLYEWNKYHPDQPLYAIKADIHHYFQSIDHAVLKTEIRKVIKDAGVLALLDRIIDHNAYNNKLGKTDAEYTAAVDNGSYGNFVKDSAGYGLAQWTYWSRKQALLNHAKQAGVSIADLNMQLGFLWEELQGYAAVMDALKKAGSVRAASDAVLTGYEKPADQSETVKKKRAEYGEGYYKKYAVGNGTKYYRVRKSWTDAASQLGAFTSLENAKSACKAGYTVYDDNGKAVYTAAGQQTSAGVPFSVQVDILDLNIRTGAGTNYAKTGETTGKGVFTIVEVKAGQGASAGWGRLKSGAGWISLDYATRLA